MYIIKNVSLCVLQVSAVPTIVGVKDGQMLDKLIGAQGADVIEALLDSLTSQ